VTAWQMIKETVFQTWALNVLLWATPDEDIRTFVALHALAQAMLDDANARAAAGKGHA